MDLFADEGCDENHSKQLLQRLCRALQATSKYFACVPKVDKKCLRKSKVQTSRSWSSLPEMDGLLMGKWGENEMVGEALNLCSNPHLWS